MGKNAEADLNLPPGFRFFPTDEELCVHYLCKKASMQSLPVPIIAEVDLYKYDPWQLPEKALFGEKEWYFFTPRDRKYPNGSRPNRAAGSGYWKATGADKPIISKQTKKRVGIKKALVFYAGKAPKGTKTNWIMHEYRLADVIRPARKKGSLRLDDWVLCRIYNKKSNAEKVIVDANGENPQPVSGITAENNNSGIENGNMSCDQICKMEPISSPMNLNIGLQNPDIFGNYEMNGMKNSSPPQQDGGVYNSLQWGSYNGNGNGNGNVTKPTSTEFVTDKDDAQSNYRMEGFSRDNHFQAQSQGQSVYSSYGMEMLQNPFSAPMETVNMPDALQEYMNNLASTDYIPRFTTHDVLF